MTAAAAIRPASAGEAAEISALVIATLRGSNAADYPPEVVARVAEGFAPGRLAALMAERATFVAVLDGRIVGTGAFDGSDVRSVFVLPGLQGRGIGAALMGEIARHAAASGATGLTLRSSLTARGFYARLGFEAVGEAAFGEERTIVMRCRLDAPLPPRDGM